MTRFAPTYWPPLTDPASDQSLDALHDAIAVGDYDSEGLPPTGRGVSHQAALIVKGELAEKPSGQGSSTTTSAVRTGASEDVG